MIAHLIIKHPDLKHAAATLEVSDTATVRRDGLVTLRADGKDHDMRIVDVKSVIELEEYLSGPDNPLRKAAKRYLEIVLVPNGTQDQSKRRK